METTGSKVTLRWSIFVGGIVGLALLVTLSVGLAGAQGTTVEQSAFLVEVSEDGNATVSLRLPYNLGTETERQAYRSLVNDSTAQSEIRTEFLQRMRSVAVAVSANRSMTVHNATIDLETRADDTVGIAIVRVHWSGFARVGEDGRVEVRKPFANRFEPEQALIIRYPPQYRVTAVQPEPIETTDNTLRWGAGTSLDGFRLEIAPPVQSEEDGRTPATPQSKTATATPGGAGGGFDFAGVFIALALLTHHGLSRVRA